MIKPIDQLVEIARENKASEIHITAGAEHPVEMLVNGMLGWDYERLNKINAASEELINKLILSMLGSDMEKRFSETGSVVFSLTSADGGVEEVTVARQENGKPSAVVRLLRDDIDLLVEIARENKASDIHLTVGAARPAVIRVRGELGTDDEKINERLKKYNDMNDAAMTRLILSMLNADQEKTLGSGNDIDFSFTAADGGRQRVNVYRQNGGKLAAAIRLLNDKVPSFDDIHLPKAAIELCKETKGLILVTGPTGSGKSTTLAAMVDFINQTRRCHILTIEDPIEYIYQPKLATIHQREIGIDVKGFNDALRSGLRENPDVILVGEMRDYETIQLAITAAETGHLVLGTLHTTGAAQTVNRIIDVFPSEVQNQIRSQLSANLRGVISQILLPFKSLDRAVNDNFGRTAAYEILINIDASANNIRSEKIHLIEQVMASNASMGMRTMNESLKRLVRDDVISRETALMYSSDKDELKKMF